MIGQAALHWRQKALEEDDAELKKDFDREVLQGKVPDGVEAHVDHFLAMSDPYSNLMAVVNVRPDPIGTATGKRLISAPVSSLKLGAAFHLSTSDKRSGAGRHALRQSRDFDDITYHLPDGMAVEGAPQDTNIPWSGHALLIAKSVTQPGQITIGQTLSVAFTIAKPEEYQDLRGFYQKVAAAYQAQLVLTASPAAAGKGN